MRQVREGVTDGSGASSTSRPCDVTVVDGLSVTARDVTVLDAALMLGVSVIDSALLQGFVTL